MSFVYDGSVLEVLRESARANGTEHNEVVTAVNDIRTAILAGTSGRYINVKDPRYGAVGDGTTDDTAAIQAAINAYSRTYNASTGGDSGGGNTGVVYFPAGTYRITSKLKYYGNYSYSMALVGECRDPNAQGAVLYYAGSSGGTLLEMNGASFCTVRDLSFNGNDLCARVIKVQPWKNLANALVTGGTHCAFERCHISGIQASGQCLSFGDESADGNTYQCDQMEINWCTFGGYSAGKATQTAGTAIKTYDGGNTKNFRVRGGVATHLDCVVDWDFGSGALWVESMMAAEITDDCFRVGSGGTATIVGCAIEGGQYDTRFLAGTTGTNGARATLIGNSVVLSTPDDDGIIFWRGNLTLLNNEFINDRTGSSVAKVLIDAASANGAVFAVGNHFDQLTVGEFPPIYDTGLNNLVGIDPINSYAQQPSIQVSAVAFNNTGGDWNAGALVKLRDVFGRAPAINAGQIATIPTTVTKGAQGELRRTHTKITVPFSTFNTVGLTQTLTVGVVIPKTRIVGVVMDTTTRFQGITGPVTAEFGHTSGGDEFIAGHDVSTAAVVKGLADADMGASLTRAAAIQGGYMNSSSWTVGTTLYLTLTSADGNLSAMNAGSMDIYILLEAMA